IFCGGSIIKRDIVLTAAHCLPEGTDTDKANIYAGFLNVKRVGLYLQRRKIKQFITHEDYWGHLTNKHSNDIALIKLTRPFDFEASHGRIGTVCLTPVQPPAGVAVRVAGWGKTSQGGTVSDHLLAVSVPVITDKICRNTYPYGYRPKLMFCAGHNRKQVGMGDSGGPAVATRARKSWQVGIVSFRREGMEYVSAVYTKVSNYREWIADTLKKLK
ncbi:serine protease, putative, partial [Ixodes scapularis]